MNYHELSKGSASADIQWFFLTRVSPGGFSLCFYDEDLNFAEPDSDLHQRNRSNRSRSERNGRAPRTYPKRKRLYGGNLAPSTVYYADTWAGIIVWYRASKTGTLYIIPCVVCLMVNDGPASYRVARFRTLCDATVHARCIDVIYHLRLSDADKFRIQSVN